MKMDKNEYMYINIYIYIYITHIKMIKISAKIYEKMVFIQ